MANDFWKLEVVQKSYELLNFIYDVTEAFPAKERFRLVDQLCRAATSVPANTAEGEGRHNRPDQLRFLYIARGSLNEIEVLSRLAHDRRYLSDNSYQAMDARYAEVGRLLNGLIRYKKRME